MSTTNLTLINELLLNKAFRDKLCAVYTAENPMITTDLIEYYKLKRIREKYITKSRSFTDNSYSKKMIRKEESIYLLNCLLFEPYIHNIELQQALADSLYFESKHQSLNSDIDLYIKLMNNPVPYQTINDLHQMLLNKSDVYRLDILIDLLETKKIREQIIKSSLANSYDLITMIVQAYKLTWVDDKYISEVKPHDDTYYARTKMSNEETFLIKKLLLFANWLTVNKNVNDTITQISKQLIAFEIEADTFSTLVNSMIKKYFEMYSERSLPMNQVIQEIIK